MFGLQRSSSVATDCYVLSTVQVQHLPPSPSPLYSHFSSSPPQIRSTLSDVPGHMMGSAAIACFLAREGADVYAKGGTGVSALELCFEEVTGHFTRYAESRYLRCRAAPFNTAVHTIQHCHTHNTALLYTQYSTAVHTIQHCHTHNTALPYTQYSTAVYTIQHCCTHNTALR